MSDWMETAARAEWLAAAELAQWLPPGGGVNALPRVADGAAAFPLRSAAPLPLDCGLSQLHAEVAAIRAAERILLRVAPEDVLAMERPARLGIPG